MTILASIEPCCLPQRTGFVLVLLVSSRSACSCWFAHPLRILSHEQLQDACLMGLVDLRTRKRSSLLAQQTSRQCSPSVRMIPKLYHLGPVYVIKKGTTGTQF